MTTSPPRLTKIDLEDPISELQTFHLIPRDACYFLYDYTIQRSYDYGTGNSVVNNIKKDPLTSSANELRWKRREIAKCVTIFEHALAKVLEGATVVPIPTSRVPSDEDYDDRLLQIANGFSSDVREIIRQTESTRASSKSPGDRLTPEELREVWEIDESKTTPEPTRIIIFDDMITKGTHFRVASDMLAERFPSALKMGIFVARAVLPTEDSDVAF